MRAVFCLLTALLLTGCADHYRYSCQDPANKDKKECNRPICETDGLCYDKLNGLPPQEASPAPQVEESPAVPPAEHCNCENKGDSHV